MGARHWRTALYVFPEGESEGSHMTVTQGEEGPEGTVPETAPTPLPWVSVGSHRGLALRRVWGWEWDGRGTSESWALTTPFLPFERRGDHRQMFTPQAEKQSIHHCGNWANCLGSSRAAGRAGAQSSAFWGPGGMACFCPAHTGVTTSRWDRLYKQSSQLCHGNILKYKWTAGGYRHLRGVCKEKGKDKQAEDDPGWNK